MPFNLKIALSIALCLSLPARLAQSKIQNPKPTIPPPAPASRHDRASEAATLVAQARPLLAAQPEKAQPLYEKALNIYREIGDIAGLAECRLNLGKCAALLKQGEQAVTQYEAAYQLYQETKNVGGQAMARYLTGSVSHDMGRAAKSISYYEQSAALFAAANDPKRQGKALVSLSRSYLEMRDVDNGLKYLQQARSRSEAAGDTDTLLIILHNLAGIYALQNDYPKAIASFQEVLTAMGKNGDPKEIASCLNNLGFLTFKVGDILQSLQFLTRAVTQCEALKDIAGLSTALDHLAADYAYLGETNLALERELKALQAGKDSGNSRLQADDLTNLARIYGQMGNAAAEKTNIEAALALYQQLKDEDGEAFALHALATNRIRAGERPQAARLEEQARALYVKMNDRQGIATTWMQSGDIALDTGRPEAMADYRKAFDLYQSVGYVYGEGNALARLGECAERQSNRGDAELFYRQALLRRETLRHSLGDLTEAKSRFLNTDFPLYSHYLGLLIQSKQDAAAFGWAQKTKARALIDLMSAGDGTAPSPLTTEERKQAEELRRRGKELTRRWLASLGDLNDLRRQARPDTARQRKTEAQAREIRRDQQILERDASAFQDAAALHDPQSANAQAAQTATLAEVGGWLPEGTALLEYAAFTTEYGKAARESVALFVITQKNGKTHLSVIRIAADAAALAHKAQDLREACAGRPGTSAERPYKLLAQELYRLLIAPAEPELASIRRLVICPDGPLWDAPFQALLAPADARAGGSNSGFLWERYALGYAYSATAAQAALRLHSRPNRPHPAASLLVMANPDFETNAASGARNRTPEDAPPDESPRNSLLRGGALRPLPYTQVEADAIRAAFPDAAIKTGKDAQEGLLKQTAADYRYLHFATHAIFNEAAPMLSGVALASPPKGSAEDGIFTARELFGMKLSADMIVFSACETARGETRRGEGLIGLTWAAFAAGVPAQVVSQWAVDDEATARLMGAFYGNLKRGQTKDAALRNAALTLRRDGQHTHPFFWAPFLLMGDWR